jgi:hypothetical protein
LNRHTNLGFPREGFRALKPAAEAGRDSIRSF